MGHYTYKTQGNGLFVTIYAPDGRDVAFLQGDEACQLCDELDKCETDQQQDYILSQYDY